MDTREIQAFIAIAKHQSFSIAAEDLFITQPAVSKRLASLEEELQQKLFDRIGRKALLTPAGEIFLPKAQQIIQTFNEAAKSLDNLDNKLTGTLRIATSHHIGLHRLPNILRKFIEDYPEVQINIRFLDSEQGRIAIEDDEVDIALVTLPNNEFRQYTKLKIKLVWKDELAFICGKQHPIALNNITGLDKLCQIPAILPSKQTITRQILERALHDSKLSTQTLFETNYLETIKTMVSIGLGWSILPKTMIDESLHEISSKENLSRDLGIIYHPSRTMSKACLTLLEDYLPTYIP